MLAFVRHGLSLVDSIGIFFDLQTSSAGVVLLLANGVDDGRGDW